jgi:hypothetical protein
MSYVRTPEQKAAISAKNKARWAEKRAAEAAKVADVPAPAVEIKAADVEMVGGRRKLPPPDPSAPPPNLFSGRVKKLEVHPLPGGDPNDPIPGHRLYWFHDIENGLEIARAEATGYRLVERTEIGLNDAQVSPGNNDLGVHVRRWVDSGGVNGTPVFAYLMKKPNWLAELHDAELEKVHQMQEAQLAAGNMKNEVPGNVRHTPSVGISSKTSSLYRPT